MCPWEFVVSPLVSEACGMAEMHGEEFTAMDDPRKENSNVWQEAGEWTQLAQNGM